MTQYTTPGDTHIPATTETQIEVEITLTNMVYAPKLLSRMTYICSRRLLRISYRLGFKTLTYKQNAWGLFEVLD